MDESNLDEYIEEIMNTSKTYEFAIDLEGNRYEDIVDENLSLETLDRDVKIEKNL